MYVKYEDIIESFKLAMRAENSSDATIDSVIATVKDAVDNNSPEQNWTAIVVGNPVDGIAIYGPFEDNTEAENWKDNNLDDHEWWIVDMEVPNDY